MMSDMENVPTSPSASSGVSSAGRAAKLPKLTARVVSFSNDISGEIDDNGKLFIVASLLLFIQESLQFLILAILAIETLNWRLLYILSLDGGGRAIRAAAIAALNRPRKESLDCFEEALTPTRRMPKKQHQPSQKYRLRYISVITHRLLN